MTGCISDKGMMTASEEYNKGIENATMIRQAGAVALAIANATQLIQNAKRSYDISSDALKLSEEMQDRQEKVFWPRELEFLKEFGTPEEVEEAEAYGRRFAGRLMSTVASTYAKEIKKFKCNASRYCTSEYMQQLQNLNIAKAQAMANARIYGRQMGFTYRMSRIDRNDQRRLQAIALSKDLFQHAANLYKNAAKGMYSSAGDAAIEINRAIQSFSSAEETSIKSAPMLTDFSREVSNSANPQHTVTENIGKNSVFSFDNSGLASLANDVLGGASLGGAGALRDVGLSSAQTQNNLTVESGMTPMMLSTASVVQADNGLSSPDNSQMVGNVSLTKVGTQTHTGKTNAVNVGDHGPHQHTVTVDVNLDKHTDYAWTDNLNPKQTYPTLPDLK